MRALIAPPASTVEYHRGKRVYSLWLNQLRKDFETIRSSEANPSRQVMDTHKRTLPSSGPIFYCNRTLLLLLPDRRFCCIRLPV